jgi:hypothetical protein
MTPLSDSPSSSIISGGTQKNNIHREVRNHKYKEGHVIKKHQMPVRNQATEDSKHYRTGMQEGFYPRKSKLSQPCELEWG